MNDSRSGSVYSGISAANIVSGSGQAGRSGEYRLLGPGNVIGGGARANGLEAGGGLSAPVEVVEDLFDHGSIFDARDYLDRTAAVLTGRAIEFGTQPDRDAWRVVGLMHLADSKAQARADMRHGIREFCDLLQHSAAAPQMQVSGNTIDEYIEWATQHRLQKVSSDPNCGRADRRSSLIFDHRRDRR